MSKIPRGYKTYFICQYIPLMYIPLKIQMIISSDSSRPIKLRRYYSFCMFFGSLFEALKKLVNDLVRS